MRDFVDHPTEHLLALPCPRRGDLFEPKWKPMLLGFGAERPCPIEFHRAPSGKILWRPLHFWRPKVFLAVAGFAAADYPADSVQVDLRRDVLKQWLATQEPYGIRVHRNSPQMVDAPEGLVASDRSAEPHVRISLPPIGRQAFHDAIRTLCEDEVNQVRRVADQFPQCPAPVIFSVPDVHHMVRHAALVRTLIEEVAQAVGEHPLVLVRLQLALP